VGEDGTAPQSGNRVSVYAAAGALGLTVDAIRKRIARGTIPHERDEDGRVWVILDTDQDTASKVRDTDQPPSDNTALISAKDETIATLREQLEAERQGHAETRRLLLEALTKIPAAIEVPSEPRETPDSPSPAHTPTDAGEGPQTVQERSFTHEQQPPRRGFWARLFGTPDE
jgi:hypothetical protein